MAASITESIWPIFMAAPLSSPSTWKSCSAAFSTSSALTSSLDFPARRFPTPSAARPAIPAGSDASFAARAARPRRISAMRTSCPLVMKLTKSGASSISGKVSATRA
ncbi:Uncharacterised protein [Mycobacteroides abscessus subsp. abscessus]|nr:Uncharacterised protein [Mycobacteroides abscessus subsp. abscessus]